MAWESLSPREALKHYRLNSPPAVNDQAALFAKMKATERMELLYYMLAHNTNILQYLHGKIEPEAAGVTDYRDIDGSNKEH